jgi:hypothetical protein
MDQKTRRPAAHEGAHRAAGLEFLGRPSVPLFSTNYPNMLAAALQRGATLYIGRYEHPVRLEELQGLLKNAVFFDDDYRRIQLIGPTALCAHWFGFTGPRCGLNHHYPVTLLRELIGSCFGLEYYNIPMDAVLAGLLLQGFQVARIEAGGTGPTLFNWGANIRSVTYPPLVDRLTRITELGKRGAIPPIRISE